MKTSIQSLLAPSFRLAWLLGTVLTPCACNAASGNASPSPLTSSASAPANLVQASPVQATRLKTRDPSPALELPKGLPLGTPTELSMPHDRSLRVVHAGPNTSHAIVYLHGMCGNSKGADRWADLANAHGTLIVVRANVPCPDRPGYKWPQDIGSMQIRIDRALERVKKERAGFLDTETLTLFGYSQGAHRGEKLAKRSPHRYKRVVLGGPPTAPQAPGFLSFQQIAVLGGELEDRTHMEEGFARLKEAGLSTKFFLLPRAHHGDYGPEGRKVISDLFNWLY